MVLFVGNEKQHIGTEMNAIVDAGSAFGRVEPLLTSKMLKERQLFGIPLWSFLPDPVSRKRTEYSDDMLKDAIARAINDVELSIGVHIQPVQKTRRLPFDRNQYFSLGYFSLPDRPILRIMTLQVKPAGDLGAIYSIDPQWIDNANFTYGQVNIIPYLPASTQAYTPMSAITAGGGAAFLSILGQLGWVPAFWEISYICGFEEGRVPVSVNELIGIHAAIIVLSELQATNRIGQYSVGLDSAQQSVNTGGSQVYSQRIQELEQHKKALTSRIKTKFGFGLVIGEI